MRRLFTKYISACLCFTILLNLVGSSALSLLVLNEHKEFVYSDGEGDREKAMNRDELELIKIPAGGSDFTSLNFQKLNDHEILYNNKLYDVVVCVEKNDCHYYYCINDSREEKMLEQIKLCTESHVDYFGSAGHTIPVTFKLFTQENLFSCSDAFIMAVITCSFLPVCEKYYPGNFFKEIFSPPENFIS